jgi:hypothetical protein
MAKQCCERDDGNCDHHLEKKQDVVGLTEPVNTICVFVEGGIVHNVTGVPFGTKVLVLDYDTDGVEDERLTQVLLTKDAEPETVMLSEYDYESYEGLGITTEQRERYLHRPYVCPFCESDNISAEETNIEDGAASQAVHCVACGERWFDLYRLNDIEKKD